MRVCFFNDIGVLGGGELWVLNASHYLRSLNHDVSVICPYRSALQDACQQQGLDVFAYFQPIWDGLPFYDSLYHFLQDQRVDLLYCTVMGNFCEARVLEQVADRINRESGRPKMAVILKTGLPPAPGLTPEYYGAGAGPAIRRLHVVADSIGNAFREWQPQMDMGFVEVRYEGTNLDRFHPNGMPLAAAKERLGIPPNHKVITCLARLVDTMKGQSILLRTLPNLLQNHPDTSVVIAGDGEDRPMLEQLTKDLGLGNAVHFTGHMDDVPSLLSATDILCHPSLNDGIPNSVVEAMAMAVPVVASRCSGIPEVIEDGVSGILVPSKKGSPLGAALQQLLADEEWGKRIGSAGRQRIAHDFDFKANTERLAARLEEELAEFRKAPERTVAPPVPRTQSPVPILFLMNVIRTGGEETELGILARYLDKGKFCMSVLTCWEADEAAPALSKLKALHIPVDTTCQHIPCEAEKVQYIVEKIRCENIQVVVACQNTHLAHRVFENLSQRECRLIEHGGIVQEARSIAKERTARYVGVSREIRDEARKLMDRPEEAIFIPSMVDTAEFDGLKKPELRKRFGFPKDVCIVAFLGRLDPKKRVEDLIEAARQIETVCPGTIFLIVGGHDAFQPDYAKRLAREAADLVKRNYVRFLGSCADVPEILTACDILVLPSIGEGMAHVISEAGAAGLAVVASDDGAAKEQLDGGKCGRIYRPGRVDVLTGILQELIGDPRLRETLGERLKQRVRSEYSAEVLIDRWHALFEGVNREAVAFPALRMIHPDRSLPFPKEIQIQTNTSCNATCVMCPYPEVAEDKAISKGRMEESLYKEILAQCAAEAGLSRLEPFLMNEPFTDTRIVDWISRAKKTVPHAAVTVTTNGSLVTPKVVDRLVGSGLDAIWFSFNGATKETYENIMGISYDKVKSNIDYLLSVRPASLKVFVNMIETQPMRSEIDVNIRNWRSIGVEAGPSPLVNRAGNVRNFDELNYKPLSGKPVRVCELPFYKMYILYNGDVVLCCMDWRRQVVLGNLYKQTIRELWQGEEYVHIRDELERRQPQKLKLCSSCSYTFR